LAKNERLPILGSLEIPGEGSRGKAGRNGEIKHEPTIKKLPPAAGVFVVKVAWGRG
jgi:hypothetical protein